jgi:hypothetical protein
MKYQIIILLLTLSSLTSSAQTEEKIKINTHQKTISDNVIFQLYPTENVWTFIKLNTRNGQIWQIHFSVKDENNAGEISLHSTPLVKKDEESNGRFILYATQNMYNFLLLDQINGNVYQIQWSFDKEKRGIINILSTIN